MLTESQSHRRPLLRHLPLGAQVSEVEGSAQQVSLGMHLPPPQGLYPVAHWSHVAPVYPASHWLQVVPLVHDAHLETHGLQVPSPGL